MRQRWRALLHLASRRCADPRRDFDGLHETTFVEYLRSALLDWGGFPGWARLEPEWATAGEPFPMRLIELSREFVRF